MDLLTQAYLDCSKTRKPVTSEVLHTAELLLVNTLDIPDKIKKMQEAAFWRAITRAQNNGKLASLGLTIVEVAAQGYIDKWEFTDDSVEQPRKKEKFMTRTLWEDD